MKPLQSLYIRLARSKWHWTGKDRNAINTLEKRGGT
jgi:hypothetical protein